MKLSMGSLPEFIRKQVESLPVGGIANMTIPHPSDEAREKGIQYPIWVIRAGKDYKALLKESEESNSLSIRCRIAFNVMLTEDEKGVEKYPIIQFIFHLMTDFTPSIIIDRWGENEFGNNEAFLNALIDSDDVGILIFEGNESFILQLSNGSPREKLEELMYNRFHWTQTAFMKALAPYLKGTFPNEDPLITNFSISSGREAISPEKQEASWKIIEKTFAEIAIQFFTEHKEDLHYVLSFLKGEDYEEEEYPKEKESPEERLKNFLKGWGNGDGFSGFSLN